MLKDKKIDWQKVVNDVAEKNHGKQDLTMIGDDITIDKNNGNLINSSPFTNGDSSIDFPMTGWSLSQLFSKFDMPAGYFKKLYEKRQFDLIKDHLDYNIDTQSEQDLFIRTIEPVDENRIVRAVLTPTYTPFDDDKLVELLRETIVNMDYDIELVDYKNNGLTSYFRLVFPDTMKDIKSDSVSPDDVVAVGVNVMNSPVGKSSVKIMPMMFRLICKNGMLSWDTIGDKSDYYQRHSFIDQHKMYEFTVNTIDKAVNVAYNVVNNFENLKEKEIENTEESVSTILSKVNVPKRLHESIIERFNTYWSRGSNMFGLVNSMTRIARDLDQDDQQELENAAGKLTNTAFKELEEIEAA